MTTTPTPTTLTPIEQAEALLTKIRQQQRNFNNEASKPGLRLLGLCNALGLLAYPQNQAILNNLGAEVALALRQEFLQLVIEQFGYSNMTRLFTEAIGFEMPTEPIRETSGVSVEDTSTEVDETPGVKRWTRQSVLNWVNIPVELAPSKPPVYLQSHPYTDVIVQLLGTYGPMSTYQLCGLIINQERLITSRAAVSTLFRRAKEAIRLLAAKQLITARMVSIRKAVNLNLWVLEIPGQIYYAIINDQPTPSAQEAGAKTLQLQHSFGTNQVLASLAGAAAMANRSGIFDLVVNTVLKQKPELNTSDRAEMEIPKVNLAKSLELIRQPKTRQLTETVFSCRVELMRAGTALEIGQTERKAIVPDGMGRIIYDTDLYLPTLIQACNLTGDEADFPGSSATGRQYWPFILEYDRATEGSEFFAEKVEAYSRFYNTLKATWPLDWGNKFPIILVVGEGSPVHLFTLMTAIRTALFKIKEKNASAQRLGNWWFTNVEWFNQVYRQYLEPELLTNWNRQIYPTKTKVAKKTAASPAKTSAKLTPGIGPHIWLPLSTKLERADILSISKYMAGEVEQPTQIMKGLKALPIPTVFNQLSTM